MVDETSDLEFPTPEESSRPILVSHEGLIASLEGDERIAALREALLAAEEEWLKRAAYLMTHSGRPVDQRKIDYTRGYFAGAKHWLGGRMEVAKQRAAAAQDPEESAD